MKPTLLGLFAAGALAFPNLDPNMLKYLAERDASPFAYPEMWEGADPNDPYDVEDILEARQNEFPDGVPSTAQARKLSRAETNCGPTAPCPVFNEDDQKVSITGTYAYASPAADEIRGPCPGLNAAANHGYLPRSGVANLENTVTGLGELYNMSPDLAGFLAAYAIAFDGDIVGMTWSIGGPQTTVLPPGLLSQPQGISFSHNKYEGDTSIARSDAYLNHGDAHSLIVPRFVRAYASGMDNNRYTFDKFRRLTRENQHDSIANNPKYFAPLFSTTLVAPAAYNFIINFMSNHSETHPSGYLNGDMFKTFFGITGDYPNFTWLPGQERIPNNWYRRPTYNQYNAINVFQDLALAWAAYPTTFRFGGNLNGVNTYEGINIHNLTGGTFSRKTLLQGNNLGCFVFQSQQQAVPDQLKGLLADVAPALKLIDKYSGFLHKGLGCPKLNKYDQGLLNRYPGKHYNPHGKATNY